MGGGGERRGRGGAHTQRGRRGPAVGWLAGEEEHHRVDGLAHQVREHALGIDDLVVLAFIHPKPIQRDVIVDVSAVGHRDRLRRHRQASKA